MYSSSSDRYFSEYTITYFVEDNDHSDKYFEEYEKEDAYKEFENTKPFVKQFFKKEYELINGRYEEIDCTIIFG